MRFVLTTALLFGMWCLLSGKFDAMHLGCGVAASVLAAAAARRWRTTEPLPVLRLAAYAPWLIWEVIKSNLHVARLVLGRRLAISPRFLRVEAGVEGDRALTLLGCSITLTPGTVTVDVNDGQLLVHTLDEHSAQGLQSGETAQRVAGVFAGRKGEAGS